MLRSGSLAFALLLAAPAGAAPHAPSAPDRQVPMAQPAPLRAQSVTLSHGTTWRAQRDPAGVAHVASGPAIHLLAVPRPTAAEVDLALRDFSAEHAALLGADELGPAHQMLHTDGHRVVSYQQHVDGVPVVGAWVHFQLQGPKLITLSSTARVVKGALDHPVLAAADAQSAAWRALEQGGAEPSQVVFAPERVVFPAEGALRPAFAVVIDAAATGAREQVIVDAVTGEVLRRRDLRVAAGARVVAEVDDPSGGSGTIKLPVPSAQAGAGFTDPDGRIDAAGPFTMALAGRHVQIIDHRTAVQNASFSPSGAEGELETLEWPASAPIEQRDAFVFLHRAVELGMQSAPGLAWYDEAIPVNLNVNDGSGFPYCNAFYMPMAGVGPGQRPFLTFYSEGGGVPPGGSDAIYCNNTGRLFKVVAHEWGHGFHDHLLPSGLGVEDEERAISEGVGDYVAFTITEATSIVDDITRDDSPVQFPGRSQINSLRYPEDLRSYDRGDGVLIPDVHHNGQIWSAAWWDLRAMLGDLYGRSAGIPVADRLHAKTLRGSPTFASAYELAIAADDDDGDPSNGTPHSCLINASFGRHGMAAAPRPSQGAIRYGHDPVASAVADEAIAVEAIVDPLSGCGELDPSSVSLSYSVDGGGFQDVPMQAAGSAFAASIPAQPDGAVVRYAISARTTDAGARTWSTPADGTFHTVMVGEREPAILWDFEDGGAEWSHGSDDALITDDWEIGAPSGRAYGASSAVSGSSIAGTDLGLAGGNGLYSPSLSSSWLESPEIECGAGCERLQFHRWLNLGEGDSARVLVGGQVVWDSAGELVSDHGWTLVDIDLRELALESPVTVRFELSSDADSVASGWNVDDVALFTVPSEEGGCGCSSSGSAPGWLGALTLALLALGSRRRRQRA